MNYIVSLLFITVPIYQGKEGPTSDVFLPSCRTLPDTSILFLLCKFRYIEESRVCDQRLTFSD